MSVDLFPPFPCNALNDYTGIAQTTRARGMRKSQPRQHFTAGRNQLPHLPCHRLSLIRIAAMLQSVPIALGSARTKPAVNPATLLAPYSRTLAQRPPPRFG